MSSPPLSFRFHPGSLRRRFSAFRRHYNIKIPIYKSVTMPTVLVITKDGNIRTHSTRFTQDTDLYKTAGLKISPDFGECARWSATGHDIRLYGKTVGHTKFANAYIFPAPVQNNTFIGTCVLAAFENGALTNLTADMWNAVCVADTSHPGEIIIKPIAPPVVASTVVAAAAITIPPETPQSYMDCTVELQAEPYLVR